MSKIKITDKTVFCYNRTNDKINLKLGRLTMAFRDTFLNMLGVETPEVQKTDNSVFKSARDFLRNGSRERLYPTWSDIKMSDSDMYRGYSYAVIQKRGNKVASLAKNNLKTWAKPEVVDEFQKKGETPFHPYLKLIEDSTKFTEKQFWKNISIYLDLAGRYYLGVIRNEIKPLNPKLPTITTDPIEFIMLNPYEIRRVVDKNGQVAGYIERKSDGRYREWPLHQIIEIRELNPFDPDNSQWAMTDAAKNAVYTINQSGDYTRQSLNGNIDAPGIITTDVLLTDEDFANFKARVTQHTKGEPLFGNGTGAIKWDSMQIDLDKAALLDINEINRTELFAVSGTSKTSLGIEQSGTTRETARVQSEQFVSDTAQPRLEDIVDFLNLDYKKHYKREYDKTGYKIEVESAVGKDYDTEQKATALKQSQFQLAMQLIQAGYTTETAYQFAEGEIDFSDLELEKGLDKPKNPEQPEDPDENASNPQNKPPRNDSGGGQDKSSVDENKGTENANNGLDLGLEPHADLVENGGVGSGNFGHAGRKGEVGGSSKRNSVFDNPWDAGDNYWRPLWDAQLDSKQTYSEYYRDANDRATKVIEIKPEAYLDMLQKGGHSIGMTHEELRQDKPDSIEFHRNKIRNNEPITTPTLLIESDGKTIKDQEGRHRLEAAILEGVKKVPVMVGYHPSGSDINRFLSDFDYKDITDDYKKLINKHFGKETKNSVEGEKCDPLEVLEVDDHCTCEHDHKVETFINEVNQDDGKVVEKAYKDFLQEVRDIEKETVDASVKKVEVNAFEISDIIGPRKRKTLTEKLKNALHKYWWLIFPLFANNSMSKRNTEFGKDIGFVFNNELQAGVDDNAQRVAEGHMETILNDILGASNKAYTNILEEAAAGIIIKAYKVDPEKFGDYFEHEPTMADALSSIRKTDILEENRKIYEKANKMAFEGYNRRDIIKAIRDEYSHISEQRATLIARNETSRAFTRSQFEADKQFLNGVGKLGQAYKVWYSRRPANEQDKICDFCNEMIRTSEENPVPFEEPFIKYGDSMEVVGNDGKLRIFTANYEDIEGGCLHPNCMCGYHLVFKNASGEFIKTLNGGAGSGNFGHSGRPGLVGGSGGGVGKFLFDGDLPSKNPQPTKEGYVVVHHNTDNETADAIAKEGLIAGKNLGAYQVSPEEGLGIWTDSRAKTDSSYGGCTISFQIPKEEYEKYAVNDTQHLIPRNIAREDIVCIDKIINENGSNGKPIKVSNLKDNVDYYTKKGLDENKVISIIAKNSHGVITEQEIKELVDFKKKVANGGPGSGNFGHAGREGEVGGSAPKGSFASGKDLFNAKMGDKLEAFRNLTPEEQAVFCEKAMEMDYKDMPQDLADTDFQRISYALGIKDKPKTVSDEEFKELVESGEMEYFRCVKDYYKLSSKEIAERLSTGEYTYQGNGDYCDGTYFTPDWGAMTAYSNSDSDSVVRSIVDIDANIYYTDRREPFDAKMLHTMRILEEKTGMKQNTSRAVALLGAGYDGWNFISGGANKEYLCMLNRKYLTVNRENYSLQKSDYERSDDVE